MEHYLKINEEGIVFPGKKKDNSDEIIYDQSITFTDFEEGYAWLNKKYGIEKREIQYIHELDI